MPKDGEPSVYDQLNAPNIGAVQCSRDTLNILTSAPGIQVTYSLTGLPYLRVHGRCLLLYIVPDGEAGEHDRVPAPEEVA